MDNFVSFFSLTANSLSKTHGTSIISNRYTVMTLGDFLLDLSSSKRLDRFYSHLPAFKQTVEFHFCRFVCCFILDHKKPVKIWVLWLSRVYMYNCWNLVLNGKFAYSSNLFLCCFLEWKQWTKFAYLGPAELIQIGSLLNNGQRQKTVR